MKQLNRQTGDQGEIEVINRVKCPNCGTKLVRLPEGYPLYDIQCRKCVFQAQVKTSNHKSKPGDNLRILGGGYDSLQNLIVGGRLIPPLIVNLKWRDDGRHYQEIRFYPFLFQSNIIPRKTFVKKTNRKRNLYDYGLSELPYTVMWRGTIRPQGDTTLRS